MVMCTQWQYRSELICKLMKYSFLPLVLIVIIVFLFSPAVRAVASLLRRIILNMYIRTAHRNFELI